MIDIAIHDVTEIMISKTRSLWASDKKNKTRVRNIRIAFGNKEKMELTLFGEGISKLKITKGRKI